MSDPPYDGELDYKDVVYGTNYPPAEGTFVLFIPRAVAEGMVRLGAVDGAHTWGELKKLLPSDMYEEVLGLYQDSEEFAEAGIVGEPPPGTPFDGSAIPGREEGFWPTYLEEYQLDWMPEDIVDKYGESSIIDTGWSLTFDSDLKDEIVAELTKRGYKCTEDEGLVAGANWARY